MGYDKQDAAPDTDTSGSKVSQAWHDARDDAAAANELEERNENKVSDSEHGPELYEIFKDAGMVGPHDKE